MGVNFGDGYNWHTKYYNPNWDRGGGDWGHRNFAALNVGPEGVSVGGNIRIGSTNIALSAGSDSASNISLIAGHEPWRSRWGHPGFHRWENNHEGWRRGLGSGLAVNASFSSGMDGNGASVDQEHALAASHETAPGTGSRDSASQDQNDLATGKKINTAELELEDVLKASPADRPKAMDQYAASLKPLMDAKGNIVLNDSYQMELDGKPINLPAGTYNPGTFTKQIGGDAQAVKDIDQRTPAILASGTNPSAAKTSAASSADPQKTTPPPAWQAVGAAIDMRSAEFKKLSPGAQAVRLLNAPGVTDTSGKDITSDASARLQAAMGDWKDAVAKLPAGQTVSKTSGLNYAEQFLGNPGEVGKDDRQAALNNFDALAAKVPDDTKRQGLLDQERGIIGDTKRVFPGAAGTLDQAAQGLNTPDGQGFDLGKFFKMLIEWIKKEIGDADKGQQTGQQQETGAGQQQAAGTQPDATGQKQQPQPPAPTAEQQQQQMVGAFNTALGHLHDVEKKKIPGWDKLPATSPKTTDPLYQHANKDILAKIHSLGFGSDVASINTIEGDLGIQQDGNAHNLKLKAALDDGDIMRALKGVTDLQHAQETGMPVTGGTKGPSQSQHTPH